MNIKRLLLGSAATLIAVSGAHAADVVVAEPEPVEYVRVCDAYGEGYFYIPGTETCMRISGYVRADIKGGDNVGARKRGDIDRDTYAWRTRATLRFHTASETELGTLRTFVELRSQWDNGHDSNGGQLRFAFIELGGIRVGLDESIFNHWTGYYGNVINDDIVNPMAYTRTNVISYTFNAGNGFSGGIRVGLDESIFNHWTGYYGNVINDDIVNPMAYTRTNVISYTFNAGNGFSYTRTNVISYTFNAGNGFSAILGVEQGNDDADDYGYKYANNYVNNPDGKGHKLSGKIDDYTPNVVGGLKFVQGWGGVSVVGAYDAYYEEWAAKARLDLNVTDQWSVWVIVGGLKFVQGWGGVSVVGAYDAYYEEWAAKARLDLNVTDQWSVWVMGGYKSADDTYREDPSYGVRHYTNSFGILGTKTGVYRQVNSIYGDWGGDWAVWGGTTFKFNDWAVWGGTTFKFNKKASFNAQVAYDDTDTFAASINVKYELVPGLVITPELTYISWDNDYSIRNEIRNEKIVDSMKGQDAFQGMVRIQRSF